MHANKVLSTICRHASSMALRKAPASPLVVVLGSTGAGKSELAIELATRFNGEVINSDAMQLYNGLPILTNKVTEAERRGIPHHLLGRIAASEGPWHILDFKREALQVMADIRSRGKLPILVGGTHYYVEPLLFDDVVLDEIETPDTAQLPILESSTETLWEELNRVDPVMARRWHPNDRRKIQRSLEIYLHTGKRASDLYAAQQSRKTADLEKKTAGASSWQNLLFWVHAEREVLMERLDKRVDKMMESGVLDEIRQLRRLQEGITDQGEPPNLSKGIWQSIGYKQLTPYIAAMDAGDEPVRTEELRIAGIEDTKSATRRYAKYQTRWLRLKQIPLLKEYGPEAMGSLYLLDSTDILRFSENVIEPAVSITTQFINGDDRPLPEEVSPSAREILAAIDSREMPDQTPVRRTCEVCNMLLVTEHDWQKHVKSTSHRRALRKKKRLALVAVEPRGAEADEDAGVKSEDALDQLDSLFSQ